MTRCTRFAVAMIACVLAAAPASGQGVSAVLGVGPTIPTGTFGDDADVGWMVGAGLIVPIGQGGAWVGGEGLYGRNSIKEADESFTLTGANGLVGMTFNAEQAVSPFVFGSVGFMSLSTTFENSDSESGLALGAGGGVAFAVGPNVSVWGLGRFLNVRIDGDNLQLIPLTFGVTIGLGGNR